VQLNVLKGIANWQDLLLDGFYAMSRLIEKEILVASAVGSGKQWARGVWHERANAVERRPAFLLTRHFSIDPQTQRHQRVDSYSMSRYFLSKRYSYQSRERGDWLRAGILAAKDGIPYPDAWVDCCATYILQYSRKLGRQLLVCTVPSADSNSTAGRDRLVELLGRIWDRLQQHPYIILKGDVLKYTGCTKPNKMLNKAGRYLNVCDHLDIDDNSLVVGRDVLVLDDVATTGATFFHATRILRQEGATSVRCVALAQTIS
jgi:hypothetical protein